MGGLEGPPVGRCGRREARTEGLNGLILNRESDPPLPVEPTL